MAEKRIVRKWFPFQFYDMEYIEGWLEDMAKRGLLLVNVTGRFAKFEKMPPQIVRYRLEAAEKGNSEPDAARLELNESFGWTYIGSMGDTFYIFRTADENARELHTDPVVQNMSLHRLFRRYAWGALATFLLDLLFICLIIVPLALSGSPLVHLLEWGTIRTLYMLLIFGSSLASCIIQWRKAAQLRRRLKSGRPLQRSQRYKKRFLTGKICMLAGLIFAFGWFALLFFRVDKAVDYSYRDFNAGVNFTLLDDIEKGRNVTVGKLYYRDIDYGNVITVQRDLLAPKIYLIRQMGRGEIDNEGNVGYHSSLWLRYYEAASSALARELCRELVPCFLENVSLGDGEVLSAAGTDYAWFYRDETGQYLLLQKGNRVELVCYEGEESLIAHLEDYVSYIKGS